MRARVLSMNKKTFLYVAPEPEVINQELGNNHFTLLFLLMINQLLIHTKITFSYQRLYSMYFRAA